MSKLTMLFFINIVCLANPHDTVGPKFKIAAHHMKCRRTGIMWMQTVTEQFTSMTFLQNKSLVTRVNWCCKHITVSYLCVKLLLNWILLCAQCLHDHYNACHCHLQFTWRYKFAISLLHLKWIASITIQWNLFIMDTLWRTAISDLITKVSWFPGRFVW